MRRLLMGALLAFIAVPAFAQAKKEPIALRDIGSFHIGGRIIEITGQPVKEVVFTPGGVPAKVDPNGKYQVEQMYVQYFLPQKRRENPEMACQQGFKRLIGIRAAAGVTCDES